jgi:hypothetical protein
MAVEKMQIITYLPSRLRKVAAEGAEDLVAGARPVDPG